MSERSSIFDMIGPVMIGPSSSHTAGVVRIGRVVVKILKTIPSNAEIVFYNSFARTYEGHGSDRAIVAGMLDFKTDDKRIKNAFDHAKLQGLEYSFRSIGNASTLHPNTIRVKATAGKKTVELYGESRGGGVISISEIDGFKAGFSAALHTLIITANDEIGSIAYISNIVTHDNCNIATMTVSRKGKKDIACLIIEMDSGLRPLTIEYINSLHWVNEVVYIPEIDL